MADQICQGDATSHQLPGTFKALLATPSMSPISRFDISSGSLPWVRPDGIPVVAVAADLANGKLIAPIDLGADGKVSGGFQVWTGSTLPNLKGTLATTCQGWTSAPPNELAPVGDAWTTSPRFYLNQILNCGDDLRVYCLQE